MTARRFELHRDTDISGVRNWDDTIRQMASFEATCRGEGCDRPVWARGLCNTHYARWHNGDARLDSPVGAIDNRQRCAVVGCEKFRHGRGLCSTHYARLQRTGSTGDPVRTQGCSSDGCEKVHFAKGLCSTHYKRRFTRASYLKHMYRMTEEDWDALFESQGRRCPVCLTGTPRGDAIWHVHHDHRCCSGARSCGRCVIAILCAPCNIGMGGLEDDPDRLERAAALMRRSVCA